MPTTRACIGVVRDLNRVYRDEPALWELDFSHEGFRWLEPNAANENVLAFARVSQDGTRWLVCLCNLSPVVRIGFRVGLPVAGRWREALNTDSRFYGGSDVGNGWGVETESVPWMEQDAVRGGHAAAARDGLARARDGAGIERRPSSTNAR